MICLPTCCIMEALTNLGLERKRINGLIGSNQVLINELGRNVESPHAMRLVEALRAAEPERKLGFAWFEGRLWEAIRWCSDASHVTCLPTNLESLIQIRPSLVRSDPTDLMILTTILDDAREHPEAKKILVTENSRCFHADPEVRGLLRRVGVGYLPNMAKFLEWHASQTES